MAKKPSKKPAKKKALLPKKKAVVAKKPVKKLVAKAKPVKKPIVAKAKPVAKKPAGKKVEALDKSVRGKAPIPPKVAEKVARKAAPVKAKVDETTSAEEAAPAEGEEEVVEEPILTDAEGRRFCRVRDCDQVSAVEGYCRYHYLLHWKKIQVRKKILTEGKLERYIEELTARYPDKFLDMLRKDLRSEKEFLAAIQELEIDESAMENELEEEAQTYIDEVRGMEPTGRETEEDF